MVPIGICHQISRENKVLYVNCKKPYMGQSRVHTIGTTELKRMFQKHSFMISQADKAVFYKFTGDEYTIVAATTDDFTIIRDSTQSTSLIKK